MSVPGRRVPITLPAGHPCATFFLDESSSRASGGSFFVNAGNPFSAGDSDWQVHARVASKLLVGNLNRGEVACVVADHVSTPAGHAFDDALRGMVNKRLKATAVVSAVCADSLSSDGLQVADLVAGAVARHRREPRTPESSAHKAVLARRLAAAFDLADFSADTRSNRVNVATYRR